MRCSRLLCVLLLLAVAASSSDAQDATASSAAAAAATAGIAAAAAATATPTPSTTTAPTTGSAATTATPTTNTPTPTTTDTPTPTATTATPVATTATPTATTATPTPTTATPTTTAPATASSSTTSAATEVSDSASASAASTLAGSGSGSTPAQSTSASTDSSSGGMGAGVIVLIILLCLAVAGLVGFFVYNQMQGNAASANDDGGGLGPVKDQPMDYPVSPPPTTGVNTTNEKSAAMAKDYAFTKMDRDSMNSVDRPMSSIVIMKESDSVNSMPMVPQSGFSAASQPIPAMQSYNAKDSDMDFLPSESLASPPQDHHASGSDDFGRSFAESYAESYSDSFSSKRDYESFVQGPESSMSMAHALGEQDTGKSNDEQSHWLDNMRDTTDSYAMLETGSYGSVRESGMSMRFSTDSVVFTGKKQEPEATSFNM